MSGRFFTFAIAALTAFALTSCAPFRANDREVAHPTQVSAPQSGPAANLSGGRELFLKNCAHCHGADAHGDDGPDLHNLDWTDEQIATRIRNGKKGQMTAFAGKIPSESIGEIITYLRTLK